MLQLNVLHDYFLEVSSQSATGNCGQIWHSFRGVQGGEMRTPVGFFLGFTVEPSELQPPHWKVELFFRSDIHYEQRTRTVEILRGSEPTALPHYNPMLPQAIGEALIRHECCAEPLVMILNLSRSTAVLTFGRTWLDDDE